MNAEYSKIRSQNLSHSLKGAKFNYFFYIPFLETIVNLKLGKYLQKYIVFICEINLIG